MDDDISARNVLLMMTIIMALTEGFFANVDTNFFTKTVQYINPLRFYGEIMFRCVSKGKVATIRYHGQVVETIDL
jgi:hypothetical protein